MAEKIHKPCYFYNTGGCYHSDGQVKTAADCKYLHVIVKEPLEKPQHLKPPCKYYHLRGNCKNKYCMFGHSELSAARWKKYFSTHVYPGVNYSRSVEFNWDGKQEIEPKTPTPTPAPSDTNQVKATILMMMLQLLEDCGPA